MIFLGTFILILSFFGMEFMAWFTHKFVMHGFMWKFHKDHHQVEEGFFERNDVFFMIYAIPSWLLIMLGSMNGFWIPVWIGIWFVMESRFSRNPVLEGNPLKEDFHSVRNPQAGRSSVGGILGLQEFCGRNPRLGGVPWKEPQSVGVPREEFQWVEFPRRNSAWEEFHKI